MGAFEHVIALVSFIYAVAITHLLSGIVALIRADKRLKFSWTYAFWVLNAFVTIVADWIGFWDMRTLPSWSILSIVFTLVIGVANYVQAALVCPDVPADGIVELGVFHAEQSRRYIGAFAVSCAIALFGNFAYGTVSGIAEWGEENAAVIPMLVLALTATFVRARWVQISVPVLLIAIWFYYFSELQGALK